MKKAEKIKNLLILLSMGYTAHEIGQRMKLSKRTIEKEIEILKYAHEANNVTHLVAIALRNKIIE